MNRHLSLRSGNPALSKNTFKNMDFSQSNRMTLEGTVNKTIIALILLFASASYSFSNANTGFVWFGFIVGFILAIVTIFKKEWAPYTVPLYAVFEGLALGGISYIYASMYTGIVQQAIFLTFGIFLTLFSGAIPCSQKTRVPPSLSTLRISSSAANGSGILHSVYVSNAVSTKPFSSGIFSAPVSKNVIGKLTSFTNRPA